VTIHTPTEAKSPRNNAAGLLREEALDLMPLDGEDGWDECLDGVPASLWLEEGMARAVGILISRKIRHYRLLQESWLRLSMAEVD